MGIVIQYVANYAPWIYAICGLVALYQLYRIWLVRGERKQAVFSLEREKAVHDTYSIFGVALVLLVVMGFTYFVSTTLASAVQPLVRDALQPAPALPFMLTPTNTPLAVTPTASPTLAPDALASAGGPEDGGTPTPPAEAEELATVEAAAAAETAVAEVSTPEPTATPAPVVLAPSCADSRAALFRPGQNEVVRGVVNIIGRATHESFQYYKIEYAPGANASGGFVYLTGGNNPVENGVLASVDTTALGNGEWTLQLVVVDQTGNWPPPCQVTITIQN
ncbi:MAG: DUF2975 domain-containing protein [Caldilineaceae bacterium]|nr:DUF2975 domain-containing protein [Caldilineaceae bacterium]